MDCKRRRKRTNSTEISFFSGDASCATNDAGQTTTRYLIQSVTCNRMKGFPRRQHNPSRRNRRTRFLLNYLAVSQLFRPKVSSFCLFYSCVRRERWGRSKEWRRRNKDFILIFSPSPSHWAGNAVPTEKCVIVVQEPKFVEGNM